MALSQNKTRAYTAPTLGALPLSAASVVYEGAAIGIDAATGLGRSVVAGDLFAGFARWQVSSRQDVSGAAPTDVHLFASGEVALPVSGAVATSVGASVFASDDDTFALTGSTVIGTIVRVPSAGQAVVAFRAGVPALSSAHVAAVTASCASGMLTTRQTAAALMFPSPLNCTTATSTATTGERWQMPAPFSWVRFHFFNADTADANRPTFTAVCAVTELGADTSTAKSRPTVGGVEYNDLRADATDAGWARVTFGGRHFGKASVAAAAQSPGWISSDKIPLRSVARTDGAGYMLMLRYEVSGYRSTQSGLTNATAPKSWWNDGIANSQPWWIVKDVVQRAAGNTIGTTGTLGAEDYTITGSTLAAADLTTAQNSCLAVAVEVGFDVPAVGVMVGGDSRELCEAAGISGTAFANWNLRGCHQASGSSVVYVPSCFAKGSNTAAEYMLAYKVACSVMPAGVLVHPVWSTNDGAPVVADMATMLENLRAAGEMADRYGHRLVVISTFPRNDYTADEDAQRQAQNALCASIATTTGRFEFFDAEPFISDGATPANWIEGLYNDETHQNEAGMVVLGNAWADFLKATFPGGLSAPEPKSAGAPRRPCADASIAVGAESTNVRAITIQLKDEDGYDIDYACAVDVLVFTSSDMLAFATTGGSTGIAIGTDGALLTVVAKKHFVATSEADGDIDLTWTDTGTEAVAIGLRLPNGRVVVSTTFANT